MFRGPRRAVARLQWRETPSSRQRPNPRRRTARERPGAPSSRQRPNCRPHGFLPALRTKRTAWPRFPRGEAADTWWTSTTEKLFVAHWTPTAIPCTRRAAGCRCQAAAEGPGRQHRRKRSGRKATQAPVLARPPGQPKMDVVDNKGRHVMREADRGGACRWTRSTRRRLGRSRFGTGTLRPCTCGGRVKPLATARAVTWAQMVDDPSAYVDVLLGDPATMRAAERELRRRRKKLAVAGNAGSESGAPRPDLEPTGRSERQPTASRNWPTWLRSWSASGCSGSCASW